MDSVAPQAYPATFGRLQQLLELLGWKDRRAVLRPGRSWNPVRVSRGQVVVYAQVLELLPDDAVAAVLLLLDIGNRAFYGRLTAVGLLAFSGLGAMAVAGTPVPRWAILLLLVTLGAGLWLLVRVSTHVWMLEPACRAFLSRGGDAVALLRGLPGYYLTAYRGIPDQAAMMMGGYQVALARLLGISPEALLEEAFPKDSEELDA
jgi:hypothetical protein